MTFGKAIEALSRGKRVQRQGWTDKGQYIELARIESYVNLNGDVVTLNQNKAAITTIAFVSASATYLGWLASQDDMASHDWVQL